MDRSARSRAVRQPGQVLVLFALLLTGLLAMLGLVFSVGLVLDQRRVMQTAADAASLRGAWQALLETESGSLSDADVLGAVVAYAEANGVPSDGTPADATYLSAEYTDATGASLSPAVAVGSGAVPSTAAGVRVTVRNPVAAFLPGFVGSSSVTAAGTSAAAEVPTASPSVATLVVPTAVRLVDFQSAVSQGTTYDLVATVASIGQAPVLDYLAAATSPRPGASDAGPTGTDGTDLQYWSDGQHSTGVLQRGACVALASPAHIDDVTAGLSDNIRRQAQVQLNGTPYAVVTVPIWDPSQSCAGGALKVVGFAAIRLRQPDVTSAHAVGAFVPYAEAAWDTVTAPSPDTGARVIRIVS